MPSSINSQARNTARHSFLLMQASSSSLPRPFQAKEQMGQALKKLKPGDQNVPSQTKDELEVKKLIQDHLDTNYIKIDSSIITIDDFYHSIYEFVEKLSELKGSTHFKMPSKESLQKEVNEVLKKRGPFRASKDFTLTKEEIKEVITNVVKIEDFHIGKGTKDMFLYIFGIPVVGLLAKRIIPGPTASISDEVLIPLMTSGTIFVLAKSHRI